MGGRRGKKSHGGPKGKGQSGGSREKKKNSDPADGGSVVVKGKGGNTAPVHGLSNLGNTCFFNAVMQCMGQSHYFKARLETHIHSPNYTCQLKLPNSTDNPGSEDREVFRTVSVQEKPGELTVKLNNFLSVMREGRGGTLNPKPVFSEICRKAPRFSGYHQQDSQELLRYLLDSLRSEEIYRIKKALLLSYNVSSGKAKVTEEDRKEIRLYGIQAQLAETFVDDVFGGRLVSTVVCLECGNCSTIHETFLDLSLPIADDKGVSRHSSRDHKRNKSGKQAPATTAAVSRGSANKDSEREASPPPPLPVEETVSKYQSKKAKKQQEKAARKEAKFKAKKQQSLKLQEFLNTPNKENVENEQAQSEVEEGGEGDETAKMEESEPASQQLKSEGERETNVNSLIGGRDTETEANSQGENVRGGGGGGEMNIDDSANHSQPASTDSSEPAADISTFPSEVPLDLNVDPATGECKVVTMDTEEQSDTTETGDTTATFPNYASSGPQLDQRTTAGLLEDVTSNEADHPASERGEEIEGEGSEKKSDDTETSDVPRGDAEPKEKRGDNEITGLLTAITLDEREPPATAGEMGEEEVGGEKREDSEQSANFSVNLNTVSTDAVLERLKVQVDSVEGSLKRFCTPELLTGSNKFACAVCTKEKAGKRTDLEQEEEKRQSEARQDGEIENMVNIEEEEGEREGEGRQAELEMKGSEQGEQDFHQKPKEETENDVYQESTTAEDNDVVDKSLSEGGEGGEIEGSVVLPQSPSCDGGEKHHPSSPNVSQPPDEDLPPNSVSTDSSIPTTHEEGELLLGDGQDDLPLLGDKDSKDDAEIASAMESDKEEVVFSDAKKQFLIESLPFILTLNLKRFVQHGRRLQKNSRHISFPTLLDVAPFCTYSCKTSHCDSKGQLLYSLYGVVEHSGGMQGGHYTAYVRTRTPIKLDSRRVTSKDQRSHQANPSHEQRPPAADGCQLHDVAVGEGDSERDGGASAVLGGSDFDVSSTSGQWYYISDSRVRTATESEVLKSQAYLLFYEQLPLLSE